MRYSMNVENPCKLSIGYVGENIVTEIAFDYSAWKKEYGDGVLALELKRYGDTYAYPVVISTEGDSTAVWTIRDTDVAKNGRGQAQLQYVVGNAVKKSAIFVVDVERSLEETTDVPDPYEEWLDDIIRISAETEVNAQNAEASAESAASSAESASASATEAQRYADSASASADSASGYANNAQTSATEAQGYETQAQGYANNASASATQAGGYADNASASATEASGYADDAQGYASDASDYADSASASAEEAKDYAEQTERSIPSHVRLAIYTLLENAAYATTGLTDEIEVVQSWAEEVQSLVLSETELELEEDTPQVITAVTIPYGATISWTTSNPLVATVVDGIVTGVSNGSCTITATAGDKTATCDVTVSGFAELVSISAVYTQSGTVYETDSVDSLKAGLVVTATYSDSSTETIPSTDYTLSGTLTVGTSTITVVYRGKTATFNVTVSTHKLFEVLNRAVDKTVACVDSGIALLETDQDFTILFDATQASAITATGNNRMLFCANSASNWKGVFFGGPNSDSVYGVQWQTGNTNLTGFNRKSTNTRIRLAYRHTKNSGEAVIAYKLNDNSVVNANQTASFVSNTATLKIGGASVSTTSDNWVGTINQCTVYDTVLSDEEISAFFG